MDTGTGGFRDRGTATEKQGQRERDRVCHETNFEDAHRRKANKYEDLVETGRRNGYDTSTVMLNVGSRGFLNPEGFKHLFSSLERCSSKSRQHFLQDVSRKAILGSHRIWTLRNSLI